MDIFEIIIVSLFVMSIFTLFVFGVICMMSGEMSGESYLVKDLPNIDSIEVNQDEYIKEKCMKCKCFDEKTHECHNTTHWGDLCDKTFKYCTLKSSYDRNKSN